jgi:hypothetical protein
VASVWSVSLDQIRVRAPAAGALMTLFAFLAPDIPRLLPTEHPDVMPAPLAEVVADPLAYNEALGVLGEFSMVALDPDTVEVHRLVQAVVRARLDGEEGAWAKRAVELIRDAFPDDSREFDRWPECEQLLPHLLAVVEHGRRLEVCEAERDWLLDRSAAYQRERGHYRRALVLTLSALDTIRAAGDADQSDVAQRLDELRRAGDALRESPGRHLLRRRRGD